MKKFNQFIVEAKIPFFKDAKTVSFDFDFTLYYPSKAVRKDGLELFKKYLKAETDVIILTTRHSKFKNEVNNFVKTYAKTDIPIHFTEGEDKADYIKANNLDIDVHYDDDEYEIDELNKSTKVKGVLMPDTKESDEVFLQYYGI